MPGHPHHRPGCYHPRCSWDQLNHWYKLLGQVTLRRTFVILSLRSGMDVLHLQAMLGHASLDMVQHYAQMIDTDSLDAHKAHSPIDNLARLE